MAIREQRETRAAGAGRSVAAGPARPRPRSGAYVLSLISAPLNHIVLCGLADGTKHLTELRKRAGWPAQTTLRSALGNLAELGAVEKGRQSSDPHTLDYRLTELGTEMLRVAEVLESWLARAPNGPLSLEGEAGRAATKALVAGWESTMLRALAARSLSLVELDSLISDHSYPALQRRLATMRLTGQVEALNGKSRHTPHRVTDWARRGVAPLLAASRCERLHVQTATAPLSRIDVEAVFLLTVPLIELPPHTGGCCRLAVDMGSEADQRAIGVEVTVERGRPASCFARLEQSSETCLRGPAGAWLRALIDGDPDGLRSDGNHRLALALAKGLHTTLFAPATASRAYNAKDNSINYA